MSSLVLGQVQVTPSTGWVLEGLSLELPPGTPVAEVTRTGYAEDGAPLRVMVRIAPGDRNALFHEMDAG